VGQVVLDPGVLLSALISSKGAPAALYLRWRRGDFELIVSPLLLDELERVLNRPKFRRYVTPEEAAAYLETVRRKALMRPDPADRQQVCRDPKDDYLVALARSVGVLYLISGDRDLTEIPNAVPPVLRPHEFLAVLDLPHSERRLCSFRVADIRPIGPD
jgi:putative PIN family toxin of toxin-antitoxin system